MLAKKKIPKNLKNSGPADIQHASKIPEVPLFGWIWEIMPGIEY